MAALPRKIAIALTPAELETVCEAIDSHVYWQLSDRRYRRDADVTPPGSDDPEMARAITRAEKLLDRLQRRVG